MAYKIRDVSKKSTIIDQTAQLSGKERVFFFVEQYRRAILGGALLVIVAILALGTVAWLEKEKSREALVLEGQAQSLYVDRVVDDQQKTKENLGKATELYRQILDEYPRTSSARLSLYLLGNTLMEQNDLPGAMKAYQQFLDQNRGDDMLVGLVSQRMAYAHLINGDQEAAVGKFSEVLSLPKALNKDQVLFELAKLEEAGEATEKALSYYKQLVEDYPASPYTNEASLRIKVLAPEESEPQAKEEGEEIGDAETESEETRRERINSAGGRKDRIARLSDSPAAYDRHE